VLIGMRRNLNFHYKKKRKAIIITIVLSCFVTLWKSFYILFHLLRDWDINYNFIKRKELSPESIPLQLFVGFIDTIAPIAIICLNIRTVNFIEYVRDMMGG